jgi:hypothetical protein
MPAQMSAIPISDSTFGKKPAIHDGVLACQSISGGFPVAKYP